MKLRSALVLSAVVCLVLAVSPANAGKVAPMIKLNGASSGGAAALATQPALGTWVTFTTAIPSNVRVPRVEVLCYQNGALVYGEAGSPMDAFLLGGAASAWLSGGGGASCVANLFYFGQSGGQSTGVYLATTSFDAAG
jgi:hypothetical protein